jgi:hypothetical protein
MDQPDSKLLMPLPRAFDRIDKNKSVIDSGLSLDFDEGAGLSHRKCDQSHI